MVGQFDRVTWGLLPLALVGLMFTITTGFAIYGYGPWRVWVVAAAAAVALLLVARGQLSAGGAVKLWRPRWPLWLLAAGAVWGNWGWSPAPALSSQLHFFFALLLVLLVAAATTSGWQQLTAGHAGWPRWFWPVCLALAAALYFAVIATIPRPFIDIWHHMNLAGDALLEGRNPYAQFVPDFYGGRTHYGFDTPGFPYPPLVLAVATLARVFSIDVRLLLTSCLLAGALLVRRSAQRVGHPPAVSDLLGCLYLFAPRQSFIVKYSHSEPITGSLYAAAFDLLLAGRTWPGLVMLGLFASSKQYLAVAAPLLLRYAWTPGRLAALGLGAAGPWLPFLLWNPRALWKAAFAVHLGRPARIDGMTLTAWRLAHRDKPLRGWVSVVAGSAVAVAAGLRRPGLAGLGLGLVAALLVTYFFAPQAFANYYLLATWILLGALATLRSRTNLW